MNTLLALLALLSLGGYSGTTPDCGADETLDLVMNGLGDRFVNMHRNKLRSEIEEDSRNPGEERKRYWERVKEINAMEVDPEDMRDEYDLELEFVKTTEYDATIDAYQCSASVTSNHWRDAYVTYHVNPSATDSSQFIVEVMSYGVPKTREERELEELYESWQKKRWGW